MADLYEAMWELDRKRMTTSDPVKLAELDVEEEHLRQEYRERMGMK